MTDTSTQDSAASSRLKKRTRIQFQASRHGGVSCWQGRDRCNDYSIGIELEGSDTTPFTDAQYDALILLTKVLQDTYPVTDITGHADIAPGRKTDPGPYFDWERYRKAVQGA